MQKPIRATTAITAAVFWAGRKGKAIDSTPSKAKSITITGARRDPKKRSVAQPATIAPGRAAQRQDAHLGNQLELFHQRRRMLHVLLLQKSRQPVDESVAVEVQQQEGPGHDPQVRVGQGSPDVAGDRGAPPLPCGAIVVWVYGWQPHVFRPIADEQYRRPCPPLRIPPRARGTRCASRRGA